MNMQICFTHLSLQVIGHLSISISITFFISHQWMGCVPPLKYSSEHFPARIYQPSQASPKLNISMPWVFYNVKCARAPSVSGFVPTDYVYLFINQSFLRCSTLTVDADTFLLTKRFPPRFYVFLTRSEKWSSLSNYSRVACVSIDTATRSCYHASIRSAWNRAWTVWSTTSSDR